MSALIAEDEIVHEVDLVWLEDISRLDYVRQSLDRLPTRRGRPAYHRDGRMVGYALLGPKAKPSRSSGTFRRRVFWLLPHDRDTAPDGLYARGRRRGRGRPDAGAGHQGPQDRALGGRPHVLGDARTAAVDRPDGAARGGAGGSSSHWTTGNCTRWSGKVRGTGWFAS